MIAASAGELRERVTLQRKTETADAFGQKTGTWGAISGGSVWAKIEELAGREAIFAGQMKSVLSHRVTIRYFAGLTSSDRISWGSRTLNIKYVSTSSGNAFMELGCAEDVNP